LWNLNVNYFARKFFPDYLPEHFSLPALLNP